MSIRERLAALPWLLGAVAAIAISVVWVLGAQDGRVSAFALVPIVWSVALLAGFVHYWRLAGQSPVGHQADALPAQ